MDVSSLIDSERRRVGRAAAVQRAVPALLPGDLCAQVVNGRLVEFSQVVSGASDANRGRATADGRVQALFDGRIDNRSELAARLATGRHSPRSADDAVLIARGFAEWGNDLWPRVLGDFAAIVWDARERTLTAARDVFGVRSLYYRVDTDRIAVASSLAALIDREHLPIDESAVAQYLTGMVMDAACTLTTTVRRVAPAHCVSAGPRGVAVRRYFDFTLGEEDRRSDRACDEELRERLAQSLRDRLRHSRYPALMLSGGIDSSVLLAIATAQDGAGTHVVPYTLRLPAHGDDETAAARQAAAFCGRKTAPVVIDLPEDDYDYRLHAARTFDPPPAPTGIGARALQQRARRDGADVLISGLGGDHLFFGNLNRYADWLRHARLVTLFREWRRDRQAPSYVGWRASAICALGPLVPYGWRPALRRVAGSDPLPGIVNRAFARRSGLAERLRSRKPASRPASYAQFEQYRMLTDGAAIESFQANHRLAREQGLDLVYPYLDRDLAQFALALPEHHRWRHGCSKSILRRAMAGRLPARVLSHQAYADFTFLILPAVQRLAEGHAAGKWHIAQAGWVDPGIVNQRIAEFSGARFDPSVSSARLWELWHALAVELGVAALLDREPFNA